MKLISPSKFALDACGFKPVGLPALEDGVCMKCGFSHQVGDLIMTEALSDTFTNHSSLAAPSSKTTCGYCSVAGDRLWTQTWMQSVITERGAFKFSKNDDIAYWLENPPKTPFIMMKGDQKIQHLLWRTPINYSPEIFQVRLGEKMLTIRHKHLMAAKEACLALSPFLNELMTRGGKTRSAKSRKLVMPFIQPCRDMNDYIGGQLRHEVYSVSGESEEAAAHIKIIKNCTPGEIWGLTAVLYANPVDGPTKHSVTN